MYSYRLSYEVDDVMDLRTKEQLANAERDIVAFKTAHEELITIRDRLKLTTHQSVPLPELEDLLHRVVCIITGLRSRIIRIKTVGR
jgi:hypothetical protein